MATSSPSPTPGGDGRRNSAASSTSYVTVEDLPNLDSFMTHKEEAVSWLTHLVPGDCPLDCIANPGPGRYTIHDPKAIGSARGVPFRGKNVKRELTEIDPIYKAQLETPGPGSYNLNKGTLKQGSVKFSQSDRFWETRHIYKGEAAAIKATDSPGPGAHEIKSSSFRGVNPLGPPHTFGATNHDQRYETASPGPAAYLGLKPKAYSPQFGFGASNRGESNKTYPGEQFMLKGREGPGPGSSGKGHGDLVISGGVLSTTKRPANDMLRFACHQPPTREEMERMRKAANLEAKRERARFKREGPKVRVTRRSQITKDTMRQLAHSKDYSWLQEANEAPKLKHHYKQDKTGCEKLAARPYRSSSSTSFGSGPRFNDAVYIPSVRSIRTDSPGPKYMPVDTEQIGKGVHMPFTTGRRFVLSPGEWSRRNNPGVGQYNLTVEGQVEEMALRAYEVLAFDDQAQRLGGGQAPESSEAGGAGKGKKGEGEGEKEGQQGGETAPQTARDDLDRAIGATFVTEVEVAATPTKRGGAGAEEGAAEDEAASTSSPPPPVQPEWATVDEFLEALADKVGWSDAARKAVRSKLHVCGYSSMEKLRDAFLSMHQPKKAPKKAARNGSVDSRRRGSRASDRSGGGSSAASTKGSGGAGAPTQRKVNVRMKEKGFKTFASSTIDAAEALLTRTDAWWHPQTGMMRSPLTRQDTVRPRARAAPSKLLLRATRSTASLQRSGTPDPNDTVRALARSTSYKVAPNPDGSPSTPVIRPETARMLAKTKGLQNTFRSMLRFDGRVASPKMSTQLREVEYWKRYMGPGTQFKARDSPGPGAYDLASSSFRDANPLGPPHTFGATNHDQNYNTASPGPLAYNPDPRPAYSPQFGFGASHRGEDSKLYLGAAFMSKGKLGPGMHLVHSDVNISGGVISSTRRPVNEPLPRPAPSPYEELASRRRKKEQRRLRRLAARKEKLAARDAAKRARKQEEARRGRGRTPGAAAGAAAVAAH